MSNAEKFYKGIVKGFNNIQSEPSTGGGDFRGGNSGCITEGGTVLGADPRIAVLRHLGIEMPTTFDDNLLFQAGHTNEESLAELMKASGMKFLREEECPIRWEFAQGEETKSVTCRPDFMVYEDDKPAFGIELKGIFSVGTAVEVAHFSGYMPKVENVCQAGHYSLKSNKLPWILQYINRNYYNIFIYGKDKFPSDHRSVVRDAKTGKAVVMKPFTTIYDITWEGDRLLVDGTPTLVTGEGIDRYYKYLAECVATKTVPKPHHSVNVMGDKLKRDKRKEYYDFSDADHTDWDSWVADCEQIVEVANATER